mmetsp:Transcript_46884/g.110345  ORF Transcript_46884/g.110345 Transcript_46884/m.110345 type:complete len:407 (-) Transcript_46884:6241-7461(-)
MTCEESMVWTSPRRVRTRSRDSPEVSALRSLRLLASCDASTTAPYRTTPLWSRHATISPARNLRCGCTDSRSTSMSNSSAPACPRTLSCSCGCARTPTCSSTFSISAASARRATASASTLPPSRPPSSLLTARASACSRPTAFDCSSDTRILPLAASTMKTTSRASHAVTSTSPRRYSRERSLRATCTSTLPSSSVTCASLSASPLLLSSIHVTARASSGECSRRVKMPSTSEWQSMRSSGLPSSRSSRAAASCSSPAASHTDSARLLCGRCTLSLSTRSSSILSSHRKHRLLSTSTPPALGTSSRRPPRPLHSSASASRTLTTPLSSLGFSGWLSHSVPSSNRKFAKSSPVGVSRAPSALSSSSCPPKQRGVSNMKGWKSPASLKKTRDARTSVLPTGTTASPRS